MLVIQNLKAKIGGKIILNDINLTIKSGETIALIGHNGSGKSSLALIIAGCRDYETDSDSKILFSNLNILDLEPHEISRIGVFVSFQNPTEVPNVPMLSFLKLISDEARVTKDLSKLSAKEFMVLTRENLRLIEWDESWLKRNLNEGMSGGEKKKSEILQLLTLDSDLLILDEIDSGLDSKSLSTIGNVLNILQRKKKTIVLITHNQKILDFLKIDKTIELKSGEII